MMELSIRMSIKLFAAIFACQLACLPQPAVGVGIDNSNNVSSSDAANNFPNSSDNQRFEALAGKYMYWTQMYSEAAVLAKIYFGYEPAKAGDLAEKGLVPFAPKQWDEEANGFLFEFFDRLGFPEDGKLHIEMSNSWAPDSMPTMESLRAHIRAVPLEEATPDRILAYRWQLLARMPHSFGNYSLDGSNAIFYKWGSYGVFLQNPPDDYNGFGEKVAGFWTNPYTGKAASRNIYGLDGVAKGDIVFLPGSEYIRAEMPGEMDRIKDFYYLVAFIWVGADSEYGL